MVADDPVERGEEVAYEIASDLSDRYDIDLDVPAFSGTMAGYTGMGVAMEYQRPREEDGPGRVKVREDTRWPRTTLSATVGHELGHAALYQNSNFESMREDDSYDDGVLRAISEGVAQHFERTTYRSLGKGAAAGLDVLGAARYSLRYTVERGGQRLWDATVGRTYPDAYSTGRDLMTGMSAEEVSAVIEDPGSYYEEIIDEF